MTPADHLERELKLGAWPEFAMPDLGDMYPGVRPGEPVRRDLDATYFDTADLRLLRRGVTLRFRRGEPPADVWTIKLPSDGAAVGLAREEISVRGQRAKMPQVVADLACGWSLGRGVRPVARMRTTRTSTPLVDTRGNAVATVDDDAVVVSRGQRVLARFRELEVELVGNGSGDLLAAADERLRAAGAERVPQMPKLTRALGRAAAEPWDLAAPVLGSKPAAGDVARAELTRGISEFVDLHAALVLGGDGAAARMREALRALQAQLDSYPLLLDGLTPQPGLAWLDGALSAGVEWDVLRGAAEADDAAAIGARIEVARARAHAALVRSLRERRYARLLSELAALPSRVSPTGPGRRRVADARDKIARAAQRRVRDADAAREAGSLIGLTGADEVAAVAREVVRHSTAVEQTTGALARLRRLRRHLDQSETWEAGVLAGRMLELRDREQAALDVARAALGARDLWRLAD